MTFVIIGNPVAGFELIGPFDNPNAAINWAEIELDTDWWLIDAADPKEWQ